MEEGGASGPSTREPLVARASCESGDDGVRRVSWDEFLRFGEPTKKKHHEESGDCRKRKLGLVGIAAADMEDGGERPSKIPKRQWGARFQQLQAYKDQFGTTKVPLKYDNDQPFSNWVKKQRYHYTQRIQGDHSAMSDSRFAALQRLGMKPQKTRARTNGTVQDEANENGEGLDLEASSGQESTTQGKFDLRLAQLKSFQAEYQHARVPKGYDKVPGLRQWVISMRKKNREKKQGLNSDISQEQMEALNRVGFFWNDKKWQQTDGAMDVNEDNGPTVGSNNKQTAMSENYNGVGLLAQVEIGEVATSGGINNESLVSGNHNSNQEKFSLLFDMRFEQLRLFKNEFNHLQVTKQNNRSLRKWMAKIRRQFQDKVEGNASDLSDEQIRRLDELGFVWKKSSVLARNEGIGGSSGNQSRKYQLSVGNPTKTSAAELKGISSYVNDISVPRANNIIFNRDAEAIDAQRNGVDSNWLRMPMDEDSSFCGDLLQANNNTQLGGGDAFRFEGSGQPKKNGEFGESFAQRVSMLNKVQKTQRRSMPTTQQYTDEHACSKKSSDLSFAQRIAQLKSVQNGLNYGEAPRPGVASSAAGMSPINVDAESDSDEGSKRSHFANTGACRTPKVHIHIKSWLTRFRELEQYEAEHGSTRVPGKYPLDQAFADWVHEQRRDFSRRLIGELDALSEERFNALKKLGFEASKINELSPSFEKRLSQLKDFFGVFGHAKVPKTWEAAPGLREWLMSTRSNYKLWEGGDPTALSGKELDALNGLDFDWLGRKPKFASQKKSAASPSSNRLSPGSPARKNTYRATKVKPRSSTEGAAKTAIDSVVAKAACSKRSHNGVRTWESHLKQLEGFKRLHNHTNVPTVYPEDQTFSNWVLQQRKWFKKRIFGDTKALSDERFEALQRVGLKAGKPRAKPFVPFVKRLRQLEEYKSEHGHIDVLPNNHAYDDGFYPWVMSMRANVDKQNQGKGTLTEARLQQLLRLGFR
jgi:Helicase associated domain